MFKCVKEKQIFIIMLEPFINTSIITFYRCVLKIILIKYLIFKLDVLKNGCNKNVYLSLKYTHTTQGDSI